MNKKILSVLSSIILVTVIALSMPSYSYAAGSTFPLANLSCDEAVYVFWDNVKESADEGYMWSYSDGFNSFTLILGYDVGYYYTALQIGADGKFYTSERYGNFMITTGMTNTYGEVLVLIMDPDTNDEWDFVITSFDFDSDTPYFTLIDLGNAAGEYMLTTNGQNAVFQFFKNAINFG